MQASTWFTAVSSWRSALLRVFDNVFIALHALLLFPDATRTGLAAWGGWNLMFDQNGHVGTTFRGPEPEPG